MRIKGKMLFLLALGAILLFALSSTAFAQEQKIKMSDYKAQMADMQKKEADNTTKIAALEADIAVLQKQIDDTQTQIDAQWDEVYALLGTDRAGAEAYRKNLADIDGQIEGLAALSPEDLFRRRGEIDGIEKQIAEAKGSKLAMLTDVQNKIADLEAKVAGLKAKMPANIYDQYTVIKGDYLWKISKKPDIYNDPYQWIRIYCVNKDQIKDPDIINPAQVFNIARSVGKNEHLVAKGEWLSKIAGSAEVFNDPTKWTKIYEANKDVISNPNTIYPYQVLVIPQ
jgi:nucleoid-associated protein YgaU